MQTSADPRSNQGAGELGPTLRRMVAVLQAERQALAGLDLDAILGAAVDKRDLCSRLDPAEVRDGVEPGLDDECRGLLDAARRLNEANRQVRNLVAANVSARLEALTGTRALYRPQPGYRRVAGSPGGA